MDVQAKTNLARHDMFDSLSQFITDDPATMRPMFDRLVCRDVPDEEFSAGGILLTAAPSLGGLGKSGRIRFADVVSVGNGDHYHAWMSKGRVASRSYPQQAEMIVQPGDRVVLDRRKEAEFHIDGVRYTICSEQQACYGRMVYNPIHHRMDFECLYDRVLVEPYEPVQTGMIARPENAKPGQGQFREGIVRAVGQGFRHFDGKIHPLEVKPGDRVWFRAEGGAQRAEDIQLFGEGLLIMREKLIWAVLE